MDPWAQAIAADAPDPEDALRRWERIAQSAEYEEVAFPVSDDAVLLAALACQRAPYLARLLARDPGRLVRVAEDSYLRREKPRDVMAQELEALTADVTDDDELARVLRRYRGDEMLRLGARELSLGTALEVGRELAGLADVSFDAAIQHHLPKLTEQIGPPLYIADDGTTQTAEFVVFGMGKLGGEELNFTSDVDVIYAYTSDAAADDDLSLHQFFTKLAERVSHAIGEVTDDDLVFRVDLRLRPEGSQGSLVNSLPSLERYYESWGRPWEQQAWLKARPCAGSLALGDEILLMLTPFIYPRGISSSIVDEVLALNQRIKAELDVSGVETGFDLKNGVGGIREVEFFVQALQLIHAGHLPALRVRSTLGALDQLLFAGIITEAERGLLAEAYGFLRHAEHLLQLESGRQTQRLPPAGDELDLLARRQGFASASEFTYQLATHTSAVASLFATLGSDDEGPPAQALALLSCDNPEREAMLLQQLGYRDPSQASRQLALARRVADAPFGPAARGAAARLGPKLLTEISDSPDPDQALGYVVDLIRRRGSWSALWRLMDENPAVLRLAASVFGTSSYLSRLLVERPELMDALLMAGRAMPKMERARLAAYVDARLYSATDDEERWNILAETKTEQVLRIALADIAGTLTPRDVGDELSLLAEVCLERALNIVEDALQERHGIPRTADGGQARLSVLALGKLGGQELGYASDLDLVFVYSADGETDGERPIDNVTYMTRLSQRLMGGLHAMHRTGRLYEVDTRLRPSGTQGLLVSSLSAWRRYHQEKAALWERQALTKLRPVAGDMELGRAVLEHAHSCVYGRSIPRDETERIAWEVHGMRERIERELGGSMRGFDVKIGRGGLIDIEFAAQFLQLIHGHDHRRLRTPATVEVLEAAAELGLADGEACATLAEGYDFIRRLEHRMRMVHDKPISRLPDNPDELTKLALRANFPDADSLRQAFENWTQSVRAAYSIVLQLGTPPSPP